MLAVTTIIGKYTWIGLGSNLINNVTIVEKCMIGAGSCIINDLVNSGKYLGVHVKFIG